MRFRKCQFLKPVVPKFIDEKGSFSVGYILSAGHGFHVNETLNVMMRFGETEIEIGAHHPKSKRTAIHFLTVELSFIYVHLIYLNYCDHQALM